MINLNKTELKNGLVALARSVEKGGIYSRIFFTQKDDDLCLCTLTGEAQTIVTFKNVSIKNIGLEHVRG